MIFFGGYLSRLTILQSPGLPGVAATGISLILRYDNKLYWVGVLLCI